MISEVSLRNFKAFVNLSVPLGGFTLLAGLNSSGKSSVLQALALLRQGFDAFQRGGTSGGSAGLPLNGEYVDLGTGADVLNEDYSGDQQFTVALLGHDGGSSSVVVGYEREGDYLPLVGEGFSSTFWQEGAQSITRDGFQYLRADRLTPSATYARSHEVAVRRRFLGTRGEYAVDFLRAFQDEPISADVLSHPLASSPRLLDQLEAWLGEICPGVRLHAVAIPQTDLVRLDIEFMRSDRPRSNSRRATHVGFGLAYVLPVVLACLTARPGSLILLENPEAHVHPRGQTAMARLACAASASGAQVVVETHSDHILNGTRLAVKSALIQPSAVRLNYFRRDESSSISVSSPAIGADGMLSAWPEGFFDEWDMALDELLG
ncbi:DUF3696 domain-containing protein [Microbacterium aurum]|uniref:AAA family ATPase n=1 Tax=Microbacterium aurum TaxID=36805 RepID=UPI001EF684AB|nr:DUF3696 domain-containing protein [Microbacterium aurum]MCG7413345.1 DUF3696 domain-containing protein [Microbacterium aurum]